MKISTRKVLITGVDRAREGNVFLLRTCPPSHCQCDIIFWASCSLGAEPHLKSLESTCCPRNSSVVRFVQGSLRLSVGFCAPLILLCCCWGLNPGPCVLCASSQPWTFWLESYCCSAWPGTHDLLPLPLVLGYKETSLLNTISLLCQARVFHYSLSPVPMFRCWVCGYSYLNHSHSALWFHDEGNGPESLKSSMSRKGNISSCK